MRVSMSAMNLGVLGMSPGNGHPYSWSAICNGYDKNFMDECPFPVIPAYLYKQSYPSDFIDNARVTHIWTQDRKISEHVARASRIDNVVDDYRDMIGKVDGVLLARDDAENHLEMSRDFLDAGVIIYIDKPLAFDVRTAQEIFSHEKFEGQIFSCSALYYARELEAALETIDEIGAITYIEAHTIKKWSTYAAHIIDPVLRIVGDEQKIVDAKPFSNHNTQGCQLRMASGLVVTLSAHGSTQLTTGSIRLFGDKRELNIRFGDTFYAFRGALKAFVQSVKQKKSVIPKHHMLTMVDWLERGM